MPIDHFVVVMMENRSFDHYFGWLGETGLVDGSSTNLPATRTGNPVETRHASDDGRGRVAGLRPPATRATAGARAARS